VVSGQRRAAWSGRGRCRRHARCRARHRGGIGIAVAADHLDPGQVQSLAARIRNDYGHIDVLVNDIWGAEVLKGGPADWNTPIWEHDLDKGLRILRLAIEYGFTDLDGSRPDIWPHLEQIRD
jgi:NAD(P)-dependent dehydrogenase (short-subunit alcohol dehydrogenase family)